MELKLWQVDAFSERALSGNPAALVPLSSWLDESLMQRIANENNLAETAFFVRRGKGRYDLRWFTPASEVDLCGHATLASAWLIFSELEPGLDSIAFETRSGTLTVTRNGNDQLAMRLPADAVSPLDDPALAGAIGKALHTAAPEALFTGRYLMAVWPDAATVRNLSGPGRIADVLKDAGFWGLIVTAPGDKGTGDDGYDFVSRFFAPAKSVPEDPVTGSAHCMLTPYWAARLRRKTLKARQVSPRGGDLLCTDDGGTIVLSGPCALYMRGTILL
ncbi:MAG: PhzF family phenazine biosynthesis protein [Alphaproteobacteria bacterium]|nr:PhzF family phenazine biosynthesis protein [Alphaproteobacteria bacterium]